MKIVHWLAVQPTPYNKYLFDAFKQTDKFRFILYYSLKDFKDLPFEEKLTDDSDNFFQKTFGIDWKLLLKSFFSNDWFVCVGWDDLTKFLILFFRGLFGLPVAFWTDSVNVNDLNKNKISFWIKKKLLTNATVIFTTGEFGKQKMQESGLVSNLEKIVSLPFFVPLSRHYKKENFIRNNELIVLLLARLIPRKGIYVAMETVKLLNQKGYNTKLMIGGTGELLNEIKKYISDNNLESKIILKGWLNREQVIEARMEANLLIHPVTSHDPYPLVVLESLANGLPVVGSNLAGSVVDRVLNGYNGFTINPNIVELEDKLIQCYNNDLLKSMTLNARIDSEKWTTDLAINIISINLN